MCSKPARCSPSSTSIRPRMGGPSHSRCWRSRCQINTSASCTRISRLASGPRKGSARASLQEEIIRTQKVMLEELSTPLIPISEKIMVMPLIGSVDSRRAQQVIETLLHGISTSKAQIAILDITGVSVVDTQVANAFISAAQAVRLLGAQVLLTGIRPEVAQTLIGLGVDLSGIITLARCRMASRWRSPGSRHENRHSQSVISSAGGASLGVARVILSYGRTFSMK